jgi:tRNA (guanine-N7-)-methyltransferase
MGKHKLERFEAIRSFANVFEYPPNMPGKWGAHFGNDQPITLELGCGRGEYTVGLARISETGNYIGMDIKGNRIWKGAKTALGEGLKNVAFIRSQIEQVANYFAAEEIKNIWITFPDPQLRGSKMKKRLTHPRFLRLYQQFLSKDGLVHLKTDSPDLYDFTRTVVNLYGLTLMTDSDDIYGKGDATEILSIKTHYEQLDIAKSQKVHYLCFKLDKELPLEKDKELRALFSSEDDAA